MTRQEQIEEMAVIGCVRNPQAHTAEECAKCDFKQGQCNAYRHAEALYNAGYRKVDDFEAEYERLREVIRQLNTDYNRAWERLKSDCREIGELKAEIKHLNTIVERLDELLGKGINDYINGIDGVEGLKDMWERSAVREFAEKVKAKSYVNDYCREVVEIEKIDELLKEYE